MNIDAYLARINYSGSRVPSAQTLRDLHVAHLRAVPFENLSIHAGEPIILDDEALFRKIVERKRGGFCYELNGLFAALLRELGFHVEKLAAGVAKKSTATELSQVEFGPLFDHMALLVTLEDQWLADVGFGDSFVEPFRIDDQDHIEGTQAFRVVTVNSDRILLRRNGNDSWKTEYRFTLTPYEYADYEAMCVFHQTSPESHFTQNRICSRMTENGRITLSGMRLITTNGPEQVRADVAIKDHDEYDRLLRDEFGIVMN